MGTPFQKIIRTTVGGTSAAVKAALGLDATATTDDCVRAIETRKAAIADLRAEMLAVRAAQREQEYASQNYVKRSAVDAYKAHRGTVEEAARKELAKMGRQSRETRGVLEPYKPVQSRPDVNASLKPGTISGSEAYNVDDALSKLREMAEARRRANPRLTREQSFALVYNENPDLAARERDQRLARMSGD